MSIIVGQPDNITVLIILIPILIIIIAHKNWFAKMVIGKSVDLAIALGYVGNFVTVVMVFFDYPARGWEGGDLGGLINQTNNLSPQLKG